MTPKIWLSIRRCFTIWSRHFLNIRIPPIKALRNYIFRMFLRIGLIKIMSSIMFKKFYESLSNRQPWIVILCFTWCHTAKVKSVIKVIILRGDDGVLKNVHWCKHVSSLLFWRTWVWWEPLERFCFLKIAAFK